MKRFICAALLLSSCFVFYSCGNKNNQTEEIYVNPVFKENLTEACDIFAKRYSVDYSELKTKFGIPVRTAIDSVMIDTQKETYDSTFTFYYKNITFHYYKRSKDKTYLCTGVELTGEFRAKQFTILANESKEELLSLFGEPSFKKEKENFQELTYTLYKEEGGTYYDSIVLIFSDDKFVGMRYEPYLEIYSETKDTDTQQENIY